MKFRSHATVFFALPLVLSSACHSTGFGPAESRATVSRAVCVVGPAQGQSCHGVVRFEQMGGEVTVTADLTGLAPNSKHGFHIHEFGDVTDLSGKSAGGHYNPDGNPHALPPTEKRHAGDLGNVTADASGHAVLTLTVDNVSLGGKHDVIGRAIVVHADPDDGGQPTGNAGARIAFGVIGIAPKAP